MNTTVDFLNEFSRNSNSACILSRKIIKQNAMAQIKRFVIFTFSAHNDTPIFKISTVQNDFLTKYDKLCFETMEWSTEINCNAINFKYKSEFVTIYFENHIIKKFLKCDKAQNHISKTESCKSNDSNLN